MEYVFTIPVYDIIGSHLSVSYWLDVMAVLIECEYISVNTRVSLCIVNGLSVIL